MFPSASQHRFLKSIVTYLFPLLFLILYMLKLYCCSIGATKKGETKEMGYTAAERYEYFRFLVPECVEN